METIRVRARVTGRVQGVFFRRSVADEAGRLGLAGFVRNEPDGSVTFEAEGEKKSVTRLLSWAETGPPGARVEKLTREDLVPEGRDIFEIIA